MSELPPEAPGVPVVRLAGDQIHGWDDFHDACVAGFGFPDYYGRNMDAWIDCMSDRETPIVLRVDHWQQLKERHPEIYEAIVECAGFVNRRLLEAGEAPVLFLAFFG